LPAGTVMPGVRTELHDSGLTFGRQIATYPVLVGIPGLLPLKEVCDVKVVGHGFRSITAVPWPLDVNSAPAKTLESLPGVGKKRAMAIIRGRPYRDARDLEENMDDPVLARRLSEYFVYR